MAEIGTDFKKYASICGTSRSTAAQNININLLVQMLDLNLAIRCVQEAFLSFSSLQFVVTDVLTPPIVLLETTFRYRVWLFAKNLIIFS